MDCTSPVFGIYPCGKCLNCRARSRQEWVFRLRQEYLSSNFGLFVTLTYDDEHLPSDGVSIRDVQLFLKRLRKRLRTLLHIPVKEYKFSSKMRYFIVSEYGDHTYRPHYHGILFFNFDFMQGIYDTIESSWQNGFVGFGEVEEGSIVYTTKYCLKGGSVPSGKNANFRLVSKMNGGIGINYVQEKESYHIEKLDKPSLVYSHGEQAPMARYYREKLLGKLSEETKIQIRLAYQEQVRKLREQRDLKAYKKWCMRNDRDYSNYDSYDDYLYWKRCCNDRKSDLFDKHTKKQTVL